MFKIKFDSAVKGFTIIGTILVAAGKVGSSWKDIRKVVDIVKKEAEEKSLGK